ncbi:serpentine type 7TM GPCR chemoreceptor srd domain-containing protein [Ditylenchus destructor]|nr:serpentine type 7TM GPCR chemoreceptor srd domain-containing protein [Ditylenchus destructor]
MGFPVSSLNSVHDCIVVGLGLTLNILLAWLILMRSVKEMQVYSKVLMQTCILDIFLLIVIGIVQPIYVLHNGWNMLVVNGPLRTVDHPWNHIQMAAWFFAHTFSIISNCVPFVYRYFLICRSKVMSSIPYLLMLFTCVLLLVPYMCLLTWATYPREVQIGANYTEVIELLGMNVDPAKFRVGLMMTTDSVPWALTSCYIVTLETISYTIIIVCGLKLQKFVRESMRQNRPRMVEVNHQLNRVLVLQTLLPITELCVSLSCYLTSTLSGAGASVFAVVFALLPFHWIPLLNPLITILVVKPYRNFLLKPTCAKQIHALASSRYTGNSEMPTNTDARF